MAFYWLFTLTVSADRQQWTAGSLALLLCCHSSQSFAPRPDQWVRFLCTSSLYLSIHSVNFLASHSETYCALHESIFCGLQRYITFLLLICSHNMACHYWVALRYNFEWCRFQEIEKLSNFFSCCIGSHYFYAADSPWFHRSMPQTVANFVWVSDQLHKFSPCILGASAFSLTLFAWIWGKWFRWCVLLVMLWRISSSL